MKKKDLIYIILSALMFGAAGIVAFTQLVPKGNNSGGGVSVEVVEPIKSDFDSGTLAKINDTKQTRDFTVPLDLKSGLGNATPLGTF